MDDPHPNDIHIDLPANLKAFVDEQTAAGGYADPAAYLRSLVQTAQRAKGKEELERLLLEGINSGGKEMSREDWEAFHLEVDQAIDAQHDT